MSVYFGAYGRGGRKSSSLGIGFFEILIKLSIEVCFKVDGGDGFAGLLILTSGISNYSFYSSICRGGSISNSTDFDDEWWSSSSFIIDFWGVSFKGSS